MHKLALGALALIILAASCGVNADLDDSTSTAVELGVTTASNALDDLTSGAAFTRGPGSGSPTGRAACTGRPVSSICNSGVKTKTYDECSLGATAFTLDGSVTLTYTDSGCNMIATGNAVTRTFDLVATGPFGGTTQSTSEAHTTWDGVALTEGVLIEKTAGGHTVKINGVRRTRKRFSGSQIFDFSVNTVADAPVVVEGSLDWANRILRSGKIEVHHNIAEFTTTLELSNLAQSSDCCYPTSGTISFNQTGSITAQGNVVFTGCGAGTLTIGAESSTFAYASCQ